MDNLKNPLQLVDGDGLGPGQHLYDVSSMESKYLRLSVWSPIFFLFSLGNPRTCPRAVHLAWVTGLEEILTCGAHVHVRYDPPHLFQLLGFLFSFMQSMHSSWEVALCAPFVWFVRWDSR